MKKLSKTILKGFLLITLFTGGSIVLSTSGVKSVNEASAAVKQADVVNYLVALGYTVLTADPIQGSENWVCHTILGGREFMTTVFVEGTNIVGHEDILF